MLKLMQGLRVLMLKLILGLRMLMLDVLMLMGLLMVELWLMLGSGCLLWRWRSRRTGNVYNRGWRVTRYRGVPRGSRQRGCIPWLYGLLHDGTHHLADATSQPAAFFPSFFRKALPPTFTPFPKNQYRRSVFCSRVLEELLKIRVLQEDSRQARVGGRR